MSEEQQQQQHRQPPPQRTAPITSTSASTDDNFAAMRQAALSMFKQRTKDLTKVSTLTAAAAEAEQLNGQVQSAIHQLQEQKAALDAQIESAERSSRERESQLRAVHGMLAQLKEDQGVFSGVQRASAAVLAAAQGFVRQHTARDSAAARLMDRGHERAQGRGPNDWRVAANDMRRRQSTLAEHIRHMESEAVVPQGLAGIVRDWARGAWREQAECAGALRECEQMMSDEAVRVALAQLPPVPPVDENAAVNESAALDDTAWDDGDAALVEAHVTELRALSAAAAAAESAAESVGLCCAAAPAARTAAAFVAWDSASAALSATRSAAAGIAEARSALREHEAVRDTAAEAARAAEAQLDVFLTHRKGNTESEIETETEFGIETEIEMETEIEAVREEWRRALVTVEETEAACAVEKANAEREDAERVAAEREAEAAITTAMVSAEKAQETLTELCAAAREMESAAAAAEQMRVVAAAERADAEAALRAERDAYAEMEAALLREVDSVTLEEEKTGEEEEKEKEESTEDPNDIELARELAQRAQRGDLGMAEFAQDVDADLLGRIATAVGKEEEKMRKQMEANRTWMESIEEEIAALAND